MSFFVVEPVENILHERHKAFQFVPILQSLVQVLSVKNVNEKNTTGCRSSLPTTFVFSGEEESLILYIDDSEVCIPLRTSHKKHEIMAVYYVLVIVSA